MQDGHEAIVRDLLGGPKARLVPLTIGADYRGVSPGEHRVRFKRRALCGVCLGQGCDNCDRVGWSVRAESLDVAVRRDAEIGTRMPLTGTDDELTRTLRTEIHAGIVEEGPRADELRRAQGAYERAIEERHARERRDKLAGHRMAMIALRLFGLLVLGVVGWWGRPLDLLPDREKDNALACVPR